MPCRAKKCENSGNIKFYTLYVRCIVYILLFSPKIWHLFTMVEHFVRGSFVFVFIFIAAFFRSINLDFVLIFRLQFTKFHAFFFCFFDIVVELIKRMVDLNRSLLNLCSKSISAAIKLFFD